MSDATELAESLLVSSNGHFASADDFFHLPDVEYKIVVIRGHSFRCRGLTAGERDVYESGQLEGKGKDQRVNLENARAKLIALGVVDEQGRRLFKDTEVAKIARKPAKDLNPLFETIMELSGMTEADVEELTGNSTDPNDNSSST